MIMGSSKSEFCLLIQYENVAENTIRVVAYETMTPRNAQKAASEIKMVIRKRFTMIMAPYISDLFHSGPQSDYQNLITFQGDVKIIWKSVIVARSKIVK